MEPKLLHTRLIALVAGVAVAVCAIIGVSAALPAQAASDPNTEYGYVYSGVKSASVAFAKSAMTDDSLLVMGSSELSTPASIVPQVPVSVFGGNDYGLRLMLVGEAYDQSLWHAIALGAYAQGGVPRNKVVLIVGPGWFVDGGQDADTFGTRFSYSLYAGFSQNAAIPDEVKAYVRDRLLSYNIDETQVSAAYGELPHDVLNAAVFGAIDDLKVRQGLSDVRDDGIPLVAGTGEPQIPDFAAMREQAEADGAAMSTTNDWGVEDDFYTKRLEPALDGAADSRSDETYSDTPEYDDLNCFLDVAEACGVDVLLVISPVMGPYYDYIGISADTREACYDGIREAVANRANVQLADFSDREYEKYFLYDIVHFGTVGWADVDKAIYEFAENGGGA
ncbi:MAG: D-alanyl-lipoteichoic acid biosynthesis protein DltD [Eggerthellaceae bacterium]|nr:D-alanyl-lipoteichoic acid biosynthesis protein DltD [Eggerthellaceae bacterium]